MSKYNNKKFKGKDSDKDKDYQNKRKPGFSKRKSDDTQSQDKARFFPEPHHDRSQTNEISWWDKTKGVYDNAVQIPFNRVMGDPFTIYHDDERDDEPVKIPGVMVINYIPAIGTAYSSMDAVNIAFDSLYARIYREYTGAANFTKSELAFHILHAVGIATYIAECKRILRTLQSYASMNHYFPRGIYAAICGTDTVESGNYRFTADVERLPALRTQLNQLIYSFNSLFIPKFAETFERWYALSSNVWMDEDIISANAYVFKTAGHYEYIEAHEDPDNPGTLIPPTLKWVGATAVAPGVSRIDGLLTKAYDLLHEIRNSSNFGIVNAAISKVYSGNGLYQIELFSENELLQPKFDRNMMYQINNALILPRHSGGILIPDSLNVTEDVTENVLLYKPQLRDDPTSFFKKFKYYMLNSYDSNTSPEFKMEATRLMPHLDTVLSSNVLNVGTEIPVGLELYYMSMDDGLVTVHQFNYTHDSTFEFGEADAYATDTISYLNLLSKIRNHPLLYICESAALQAKWSAPAVLKCVFGDLTTYTTVNRQGLDGLNKAALLSCYFVQ